MASQRKLISKKELEMILQDLESFMDPSPDLEQYPISPQGAALILSIITNTYDDLKNKVVGDLGCGTGILAIGAALLGAERVIGVDIDQKQLKIAKRNAQKLGLTDKIKWIQIDIEDVSLDVDVIIQNPPFGIQKRDRGQDIIFLRKAIEMAKLVYSIHKSGPKNRDYLQNFIRNEKAAVDAIIPLRILLPQLFPFHKKKFYPIQIDLYRILVSN